MIVTDCVQKIILVIKKKCASLSGKYFNLEGRCRQDSLPTKGHLKGPLRWNCGHGPSSIDVEKQGPDVIMNECLQSRMHSSHPRDSEGTKRSCKWLWMPNGSTCALKAWWPTSLRWCQSMSQLAIPKMEQVHRIWLHVPVSWPSAVIYRLRTKMPTRLAVPCGAVRGSWVHSMQSWGSPKIGHL